MAKTTITTEELAKIAKLAKLDLRPEELSKFSDQLSSILGYVGQLSQVDVTGVIPTAQINRLENITREDTIDENRLLDQKEATGQSSKVEKNMFVVKAVIDSD